MKKKIYELPAIEVIEIKEPVCLGEQSGEGEGAAKVDANVLISNSWDEED